MNDYPITDLDTVVLIAGQSLLLDNTGQWSLLSKTQLSQADVLLSSCEFIQVAPYQQGYCYAAIITAACDESNLISFRELMPDISRVEKQLISRALQLVTWQQQHQYCGQCGCLTRYHAKENARQCEPCELFFYPKISPCMMCLVTRDDYCLLAQHQKHRNGFYATLAGFVEAGESVEQTLHREVMEEVGLKVKNLSYFQSQSWPFPHQLMIGYFAEYDSGDIRLEEEEITDAQWFHYTQLPDVPSIDSLSGMMIQSFVKQRTQANTL